MYKLYFAKDAKSYFLVPETKCKSSYANKLCNDLVSNTSFGKFMILDDLYKTQYGAPTEHGLLTYRTQFVSEAHQIWLKKNGEPAHFTAPTGGLGAAVMVHCEMTGKSAIKLTAITDGHYYSSEMMTEAYEKCFKEFGFGNISEI